MNSRVRAVIGKEFREYRRNKLIIVTMSLLPVIFLVLPLVATLRLPGSAAHALVARAADSASMFFLIAPVLLPTTIAAYSVTGEREQGTLEPVLTTPVTDNELLFGKAIAATVPAVLLSWLLFTIFAVIIVFGARPAVAHEFMKASRIALEGIIAPLLAVLAIVWSLAMSARSGDVRVSQQLSGLVMLPAIGLVAAVSYGAIRPTVIDYSVTFALIALVDAIGWRMVTKAFNRERLLSRFES